jgi:hypothetical protein
MGFLDRVKSFKGEESYSSGLLKKSLRVHEAFLSELTSGKYVGDSPAPQLSEHARAKEWTGDSIQKIIDEIDSLSRSLESPAYLYTILKKWMEFIRGAFLLVDNESQAWITCASSGWEEATIDGLKTLAQQLLTFQHGSSSSRIMSSDDLLQYKDCFSEADFGNLKDLMVKIFYRENNPVALLALTDVDLNGIEMIDRILQSELMKVIERRYDILEELGRPLLGDIRDLKGVLELREESKRSEDALTVLRVSFDGAIIAIRADNSFINPAWTKQDLFLVLSYTYANIGRIFTSAENYIYLILNNPEEVDGSLLVHQSSHSLGCFFKETDHPLHLYPEIVHPEELAQISDL